MKRFLFAVVASLVLSTPAQALSAYKTFHYCVYWPTLAVVFVLAGPAMVVSTVVQHCDDKLKNEAVCPNPQEVKTGSQ